MSDSAHMLNGARAIAEFLGVPTSHVYSLAATGQIPVIRLGAKICARRATLEAFLAAMEAQSFRTPAELERHLRSQRPRAR